MAGKNKSITDLNPIFDELQHLIYNFKEILNLKMHFKSKYR